MLMSVINNIKDKLNECDVEVKIIPKFRCRACGKEIIREIVTVKFNMDKKLTEANLMFRITNGAIEQMRNNLVTTYIYGHNNVTPMRAHECSSNTLAMCELESLAILSINGIKPNFNETNDEILRLCNTKNKK
jgi:hypothetical protein